MTQSNTGYDYPEQSSYPRWKVRLILRFSEFGLFQPLQKKIPSRPTRSLAGTNLARGGLQATPDPSFPGRFVLQAPGGLPGGNTFGPQARTTSDDGFTQVLEGVVPTTFSWSQNGLRTASTIKCDMPFIACPIDPRTLRSCAIEFFLGTVSPGDAVAAIDGGGSSSVQGGASNDGAQALDLLPDTYTDVHGQQRTNLRFQGWVDEWEVTWDDDISRISLDCTDNTRLLLNVPAPVKAQVSKDLPLDKAIAQYLTFSPTFAGISVEYRPSNETAPTLANIIHKSAFLPGQGPPVALTHGSSAEKAMVLDYLTDVVRSTGHSLYFDGTTLVIQRARTLMASSIEGRPNDPYIPRTLASGSTLQHRTMIFGRNLKSLKITRNLGAKAPANISIRAYNPDTKSTLVERFPLPQDQQIYSLPGTGATDAKWLELEMPGGVIDRKTMRIYAQEVYESLWRQELEVTMTTDNFSSYGGGWDDPDILDSMFGDPYDVFIARDDYYSTLGSDQQQLDARGANSDLLRAAGFPADFADAYAKAYTDSGLQQTYRLHTMDVTGSSAEGEGVGIALHCVNYVEVTSDKSLSTGEEPPSTSPAQQPQLPNSGPPAAGPTQTGN